MFDESSLSKPPTLAPISYQSLEHDLIRNAESTSRTAKTGIIDTSASKEKVSTEKKAVEVQHQTRENIRTAARYIHEKKQLPLVSPQDVQVVVMDINAILGEGFDAESVQKDELYNLRTHEISPEKGYGVPISELKEKMIIFYDELFEKIRDCETGAEEAWRVAAWIEFQIDHVLHPYADRCGRMAKILAAYVLHKFNKRLPDYGTRNEYYAAFWNPKNDTLEKTLHDFEFYYKTAFERGNA